MKNANSLSQKQFDYKKGIIIRFWEAAHLPLGVNVGLRDGQVSSFPEKYNDPKKERTE